MSFDGFSAVWTMAGGIGIGEAWPTGVVAGFDGGKPGGLDGEPSSCMQVVNKGTDTWKIGGIERRGSVVSSGKGNMVGGVVIRQQQEAPKLGAMGSRHPWRRMESSVLSKMVTEAESKSTLQPLSQSGPTPKRVCLKEGMILPLLAGRVGRRWSAWVEE